jgi:hypothetical protein
MTKIVPNDLLNPTEKTIKNWNCSFIAVEGPNVLDKLSLEDLEIPYESQYRARVILKAGDTDQPLSYGFIGKAVTFLMIKVTYDSVNDPYYQYEQEKYNISYYFDNDPVVKSLGRLLIMTGSVDVKIPQIYLSNPLDYDVTLDVLHATIDSEYDSGTTYGGFGVVDLDDVILSGLTSGDTLMYFDGFWHNVPYTFSGGTGGFGSSGTSGKDGLSGSSGTSGINGAWTGATIHNEFYYLTGNTSLYVPLLVASGLTLTGLTSSGLTNYIVTDTTGKLYITTVIGMTEDVPVDRDSGTGTRTLHFANGLYTGYTDS